MKKIIVIGCPGSEKTTFAEKLNKCTGLPLFYLDAIWHKPYRTHISREDFPNQNLPKIYELIDKYREGKEIVIFKSREEADSFTDNLGGIKE